MKSNSLLILMLMLLPVAKSQTAIETGKLIKLWETTGLSVPESVLPVPGENLLLVSNIGNPDPTSKAKSGFISRVGIDGSIKELKWVEGLNSPKGMTIVKDKLYVTVVDHIAEIELKSGKILKTYAVENAVFLNDITADKNGVLYITDSKTNTLHKLHDGKESVLIKSEDFSFPNGLFYDGKDLIIGTGDKIVRIDLQTLAKEVLYNNTGTADGLYLLSPEKVLFSNWEGKIFRQTKGSEKELLLDTSENKKMNTTDLGYDPGSGKIFVPTFFGNSVVCYKLK